MNKFDQFVKHRLKEKYYIRYADDFVILSRHYEHLAEIVLLIKAYLEEMLKLEVHPNKISIQTVASGIDFLGYVSFTDHKILRTKTKKRMLKKIINENKSSYLGLLKHCNSYKLERKIYSGIDF